MLDQDELLTERPTAPNPKIATVEPFGGLATFKVAPRPKIPELINYLHRVDK